MNISTCAQPRAFADSREYYPTVPWFLADMSVQVPSPWYNTPWDVISAAPLPDSKGNPQQNLFAPFAVSSYDAYSVYQIPASGVDPNAVSYPTPDTIGTVGSQVPVATTQANAKAESYTALDPAGLVPLLPDITAGQGVGNRAGADPYKVVTGNAPDPNAKAGGLLCGLGAWVDDNPALAAAVAVGIFLMMRNR